MTALQEKHVLWLFRANGTTISVILIHPQKLNSNYTIVGQLKSIKLHLEGRDELNMGCEFLQPYQIKELLMQLAPKVFSDLLSTVENSKQFRVKEERIPFHSASLVHIDSISGICSPTLNYLKQGAVFLKTDSGSKICSEKVCELIKFAAVKTRDIQLNVLTNYYKKRDLHDPTQNQFQSLLSKVKTLQSIDIYKTEYPHGYETEITYCESIDCWIISFMSELLPFSTREHIIGDNSIKNALLKQICLFWMNYIDQLDSSLIKAVLTQHSLKGKISYSLSKAVWHSLVKLDFDESSMIQNPNTAQKKLEELGFSFVTAIRLATVVNEDQIYRIVEESIRSTCLAPYQSLGNSYGSSQLQFISPSTRQVIQTFNLLTFDDEMFNYIQVLVLSDSDPARKESQLKQKYEQCRSQFNYYSPYPWLYYQLLLTNVSLLVQSGSYTIYFIKLHWEFILKLTLYLTIKRIPIKNYALKFAQSQSIRNRLNLIPFSDFGAVGCKIINFYFFVSLGNGVKQLKNSLRINLESIDHHFRELSSQVNLCQNEFIDVLEIDEEHQIRNYFLEGFPEVHKWQAFLYNLSKRGNTNTFCKAFIIVQPLENHLVIQGNKYPFSIQTISNAYFQAYTPRRHERLLKDKIVELRKVTERCEQLKNLPICNWKSLIEIQLHSQAQNALIKEGVKFVLASQSNEDKIYYPLLARIQKNKQPSSSEGLLNEQATSILSKSYFNMRVLLPEELP